MSSIINYHDATRCTSDNDDALHGVESIERGLALPKVIQVFCQLVVVTLKLEALAVVILDSLKVEQRINRLAKTNDISTNTNS